MRVNHLHLMVPDVPAATAFLLLSDGPEVPLPKREHAYSFYVNAPGGFLVEVGA
jgi:hypothetical protein